MSLTKEECLQALKTMTFELLRTYDCRVWSEEHNKYILRDKFQNKHDIIMKLIEEHFNNPPLKLEDIHVGMWLWDNVDKMYTLVVGFYTDTCIVFRHGMKKEYEPNRFYLKEVCG